MITQSPPTLHEGGPTFNSNFTWWSRKAPRRAFAACWETIGAHGLFGALYTDRGSHYFLTPWVGGKVDKRQLTQVGQALVRLGIRHIPSYSPEGRGRMERVFGTLQQRLPPELRRAGVTTLDAANAYLRESFVPAYNARGPRDGGFGREPAVLIVAGQTTRSVEDRHPPVRVFVHPRRGLDVVVAVQLRRDLQRSLGPQHAIVAPNPAVRLTHSTSASGGPA